MASDNRNQDKVKLREGEWNNYSCFLFLISIAQNPSLSGALWLILVFSVCMGQFVERDQGSFYYPRVLESHGSVPLGLKPGYRVTEPCQVSLDRKPLSAGPGDSFFVGHKVRCLTGFLVLWFFFLIDDITCKQTKHDQQIICQMCFTVIYQYAVCLSL